MAGAFCLTWQTDVTDCSGFCSFEGTDAGEIAFSAPKKYKAGITWNMLIPKKEGTFSAGQRGALRG
ncbi:hypothetical protein P606_13260 [Comamonas thiooxydans]|nr:hypothetical protein P606_13260 [Comamonas thiooxydans]